MELCILGMRLFGIANWNMLSIRTPMHLLHNCNLNILSLSILLNPKLFLRDSVSRIKIPNIFFQNSKLLLTIFKRLIDINCSLEYQLGFCMSI